MKTFKEVTGGLTPEEIGTKIKDAVVSDVISSIIPLTQAEYDALTPDPNVLYIITE
jgi:hypothetical protein